MLQGVPCRLCEAGAVSAPVLPMEPELLLCRWRAQYLHTLAIHPAAELQGKKKKDNPWIIGMKVWFYLPGVL